MENGTSERTPQPKSGRLSDGGRGGGDYYVRPPAEDDPDDPEFAGWQHFGDYNQRKQNKLREQTVQMAGPGGPRSDIFRGCVVHVNGHTVPSRKELWEQIAIHGGSFERELRPGVTHVMCSVRGAL